MSLPSPVAAIVLDIEGTTSSLSYVRDRLFPFSRDRIDAFLAGSSEQVAGLVAEVRELAGQPAASIAEVAAILRGWIDTDVKAPPLKSIQGLIWAEGFADGSLLAPVYDDVPPALAAWTAAGIAVHSYSSGSVGAQREWYRHTQHGDLLGYFGSLFDTRQPGPKREPSSYLMISRTLGVPPGSLLFASDEPGELVAASQAGWQAVGVRRPGDPGGQSGEHNWISDFDSYRPSKA
ncbi:MAG: acireductone synthase [Actinomycetota bacterium]|nr:acireductone synthase [Actinomycetota bacterium]